MCVVRYESKLCYPRGCPVGPVHLLRSLSPLNCLCSSIASHSRVPVGVKSHSLELLPPAFPFFTVVLAIVGPLYFRMNFRICLPVSTQEGTLGFWLGSCQIAGECRDKWGPADGAGRSPLFLQVVLRSPTCFLVPGHRSRTSF